MASGTGESWVSGDAYEAYVGRWSRLVAREFVDWLPVAPRRRWLDVGCGTGALTVAVLRRRNPLEVVAVDPSPDHVVWAAAHVDDARARFEVAEATGLPPGPFAAVVAGSC